jgi:pimeloyl-ACP methyl ester carboxylesterase
MTRAALSFGNATEMSPPLLLVHGAFHTGECWNALQSHLREHGQRARALTLSGHSGNSMNPWLVSMATYGTDVIAAAEALGEPCIVLGHSMAGMVISEATERRPDLFVGLIYLSAMVPRFGRSSMKTLPPVSSGMRSAATFSLLKGTATISPELARRHFYNRCTGQVQDAACELLCPQPLRASMGTIQTSAERLGTVTKHYIECIYDETLPLESQRAMQRNMPFQTVQSIDSDHSPFLCMPAVLADVIERITSR